ncbi:MAG TPA: hypothetical protein VGB52_05925 [Actinomycetota bacterium]
MSRARWLLGTGTVVALASAFAPLSSDEAAWIAVERRVAAGGVLYVDAIDNKSPFVFLLVRVLDVLPGPFELWRGVLLGVLIVAAAVMAGRVFDRLGSEDRTATAAALLVGVSPPLASVLTLTIELPAAVIAIGGLTLAVGGRHTTAGALIAAGARFDPRALALLPGLAWLAWRRDGTRAGIAGLGRRRRGRRSLVGRCAGERRPALRPSGPEPRLARGGSYRSGGSARSRPSGDDRSVGRDDRDRARRRGRRWSSPCRDGGLGLGGAGHYRHRSLPARLRPLLDLVIPILLIAIPAAMRRRNPTMPRRRGGRPDTTGRSRAGRARGEAAMEQADTLARYQRVAADLEANLQGEDTFVQVVGDPYLALMLPVRGTLTAAGLRGQPERPARAGARPDLGGPGRGRRGGGGGEWTLIDEQELASDTAQIDFTNIPKTHSSLVLEVTARATTTGTGVTSVQIQLGDASLDTGSNHAYRAEDQVGASTSFAATVMQITRAVIPLDGQTAGARGSVKARLFDYTEAAEWRNVRGESTGLTKASARCAYLAQGALGRTPLIPSRVYVCYSRVAA